MKLTPDTNVHELLDEYPFLLDFLAGYNPKFSILKSKVMRVSACNRVGLIICEIVRHYNPVRTSRLTAGGRSKFASVLYRN